MAIFDSSTYAPYKKELKAKYKHLLELLDGRDEKKLDRVRKAFEIAAESHDGMKRKSGEPYLFHPIEVAIIAVEVLGLGSTSVICALLHDTVEDTSLTLEDVELTFGKQVRDIVDGLTKISSVFGTVDKNVSMQA